VSNWFVLEGPDGSGKSTQAKALCAWLTAQGRAVLHLREPGSTPVGEALRALLLDPRTAELRPETEALLFTAARAELVQGVVRPALERGAVVVSERCWVSTLVYQGVAGGLDLGWIEDLTARAHQGCMPDAVFVLDVPVPVSAARISARSSDRFEGRGRAFLQQVRAGFRAMAQRDSRLVLIDAEQDVDAVQHALRAQVRERLS
jgi:dTMP kinase